MDSALASEKPASRQRGRPVANVDAAEAPLVHGLSHNMRCLRKRMGLSQEDLAGRVGLNRGNIASYEKGTAEPKLCNLLKLSQLFGVSIHDLTRRDMSCEKTYNQAYASFLRLNSEEAAALQDFEEQATELREVYEGITRCHEFLVRKAGELDGSAKIIDGQFAQMRHLTEEVLTAHKELLEFVRCRLKE